VQHWSKQKRLKGKLNERNFYLYIFSENKLVAKANNKSITQFSFESAWQRSFWFHERESGTQSNGLEFILGNVLLRGISVGGANVNSNVNVIEC